MMSTDDQPTIEIPYHPPPQQQKQTQEQKQKCNGGGAENAYYEAGMVPKNAMIGDPKGIPIQQTIYRDTPAPFECCHCATSSLTTVRSKPSLAAVVGCMIPFMTGFCFLCPSMDCLWHKYHYCPSCNEKVADFEKSDLCMVMDPSQWTQKSFALPA